MQGDRLHHAWLFCGPEGVGKSLVAAAFARTLLISAVEGQAGPARIDPSKMHPMGTLFDAGTHPDHRLLERLPKDEKVRALARNDWPADAERARSINVEQIRKLTASFAIAPSMSRRRTVLIDSIDDLERGASNALLKSLEEPPAGTIFLLVSHAPGRLLPTIRSRCRTIKFSALPKDDFSEVLEAHGKGGDAAEISALFNLSGGAPGRAIQYAGNGFADIEATLHRIAQRGDPDFAERFRLAKSLSGKAAQTRYEAFVARVPSFLADQARTASLEEVEPILNRWGAARNLAQAAILTSLDQQAVVLELTSLVSALAPKGASAKA